MFFSVLQPMLTEDAKISINLRGRLHDINVREQLMLLFSFVCHRDGQMFLVLSSHQRQVDRTLVGQVVKDVGCFDSLISALLIAKN